MLFLIYPELRPLPLHEGIWGLLANVLLLAGVSLITEPESQERVERYINA
ncbi:MAG: hypothetical protein U5K69_24980 [Balneolaceae bacterium]|nr:hypothetical protein [Balneolaceae bacterium]